MASRNYTVLKLLVFMFSFSLHAGFSSETMVHIAGGGMRPIQDIQLGDHVICWNQAECIFEERPVTGKIAYKSSHVILLETKESGIYCDKMQSFYDSVADGWSNIRYFQGDEQLLKRTGHSTSIDFISSYDKDAIIYDLTIEEHHNFCVGNEGVVVHNFAFTIPILTFGFGEVLFASGTLKAIVAGVLSYFAYSTIKEVTGAKEEYENYIPIIHFDEPPLIKPIEQEKFGIPIYKETKKPDPNGAQAPGMPTEVEGFYPPKNWEGIREPNPGSGEYGWKDKKDDYWIPTGHKPTAHGGPHWDVKDRKGKKSRNVYPGGKIR